MRKHGNIIQSNQAVCSGDALGVINDRKQRGTAQTLAAKVKGTGKQNRERQEGCPDLDFGCRPQVLAGAPGVLSFPLPCSGTTHKMERMVIILRGANFGFAQVVHKLQVLMPLNPHEKHRI